MNKYILIYIIIKDAWQTRVGFVEASLLSCASVAGHVGGTSAAL